MTRAEMNWKIFRSILPLIALVAFAYYTQSLKPDYTKKTPILSTDANDLIWRFQMNEGEELINQIVQITGKVTGFDSLLTIINHRIICSPNAEARLQVAINDTIHIKGRCIGYDDLLEELRLDHVVKIKN
tara:strand:+ start:85 stop:474 length:390 start_codon:yes stop_codon:yes gene_type:complete